MDISTTQVVMFLYMKTVDFWEFILLLDVLVKYFILYKCFYKYKITISENNGNIYNIASGCESWF